MCAECRMSPCHPSCPNASDPPAVTYCYRCKRAIVPGDEYAHINGLDYCENCIDDMPCCVLIPLLGGDWKTASKEDIYDGYDG